MIPAEHNQSTANVHVLAVQFQRSAANVSQGRSRLCKAIVPVEGVIAIKFINFPEKTDLAVCTSHQKGQACSVCAAPLRSLRSTHPAPAPGRSQDPQPAPAPRPRTGSR